MNHTRIVIAVVAIVSLFALIGVFGTDGSSAEQNRLQLLIYDDGEFTEFSLDLSADELLAYFPEPLVSQLLEGRPVRLSSPAAIEGIQDLVDTPVGGSFDDIVGLYAQQQEEDVTWGCVKCCYASPPLSCCCKEKDPDEVSE